MSQNAWQLEGGTVGLLLTFAWSEEVDLTFVTRGQLDSFHGLCWEAFELHGGARLHHFFGDAAAGT